jgi:TPR repeat protein
VRDLRNAADSGDATAMDKLGQRYERGDGVPADPAEAFRWYGKAAATGLPSAQYHLGTLYDAGMGTVRDREKAVGLYRQSAAGGNSEAQARLAQLGPAAARPAPKPPNTGALPVPGAVSIRVPANVPWTDTGIRLRSGDTVTLNATGMIAIAGDGQVSPKAPGGFRPNCAAAAKEYSGSFGTVPAPRLPCWSLIGRVGGDGMVFEVGANTTFRARSSGKLLLGVNGDGMGRNSGYWTVAVVVQKSD